MANNTNLRSLPAGRWRLTLRELIICALSGALLVAVQVALAFLPNIELVSLLIIAYTVIMGWKALFPVALFVVLEGLIYGVDIWFLNYTYVWAVLVFLAVVFRKRMKSAIGWAILSGAYGLAFGAMCTLPYFVIGGPTLALASFLSGIPFDLLHCAGNFTAALLLLKPVMRAIQRGMHILDHSK